MSSPPRKSRVVFAVSNNVQAANAAKVGNLLQTAWTYLDTRTSRYSTSPPSYRNHADPVSVRRVLRLRQHKFSANDLVVVPQDIGVEFRALCAAAQSLKNVTVLMPDGAVSKGRMNSQKGTLRFALDVVDRALVRSGVLAGSPGVMGGTSVECILAWGKGWSSAFPDERRLAMVGFPRADHLQSLRAKAVRESGRVLVCSQPLFDAPEWARPSSHEWYSALQGLLINTENPSRIRLRLHPRERSSSHVPDDLRAAASDESLVADLEWSDVVAAPFSTVLLEAAAGGRRVVALWRDEFFEQRAREYPFLADRRMPHLRWSEMSYEKIKDVPSSCDWLCEDYLIDCGKASQNVAALLDSLVSSRAEA